MAVTNAENLKLYDSQFQSGMYEKVAQQLEAFNGASRNTIRLFSNNLVGQYSREAFFKYVSGLVTRRNLASNSGASIINLDQDEKVGVRMNRKIGPVDTAIGALKLIGKTQEEVSFIIGQMFGESKMQDMLNNGIAAVSAALIEQGSNLYDATSDSLKTANAAAMNKALAKMGDRASRVIAWVMHSKAYHDLIGNQITDKVTGISDIIIYGASPGTLGRPVIVTDAPALYQANGSGTSDDIYFTLGLVENAVSVAEPSEDTTASEVVTGSEQLVFRVQSEFDVMLNVLGFAWNIGAGGANPTSTAVATGTNWTKIATSNKDLAGVVVKSQ